MNRTLLARATEGTAAPTPGYLYKDLTLAASANPTAAMEMAQYLTNRLATKSNPNIKYKCLKVIAKLAEDVPRNQFRRCVSQQPSGMAAIKEAVHFRGPPDPVCGDEPNQKVRQAAQEALDAVYREAPSSETVSSMASASAMSGGYGPSPSYASSMSAPGGGGGRRMEGIGNPRYQDPRLDPRYNNGATSSINGITNVPAITNAVREAGEVVLGMIKDPLARNIDISVSAVNRFSNPLPGYSGGGGGGGGGNPYQGRPPPGSSELSRQTGGQWTMASNRGPGAITSHSHPNTDEYYKARDSSYQWTKGATGSSSSATSTYSGGVGGSWANATTPPPPLPSAPPATAPSTTPSITVTSSNPTVTARPTGQSGAPASDGTFEKNLILELCPPGGMKPVPPPDKLANFKRVVPTLNPDLVCPVLLDCLEEGQPWIIRAKALCVMEASIEAGGGPYRDFLYACAEEIMPLAAHARTAIKDPARRVLHLLGVDANAATASSALASQAASNAHQAAPPPNLLDFDDDDDGPTGGTPAPPPASAPPPPPPAPAPGSSSALFGGMQVKQKVAATATATAASAAPAPASTTLVNGRSDVLPPPAPTSGNLLDFGNPYPAAETNGNNTSQYSNGTSNTDIFRDLNTKTTTTMTAAAGGGGTAPPTSIFDQMSFKESEDKKTDSEDAGDITHTASSGSAFGFINQSTSGEQAPGASAQQQAPQRPKQSFDPLLNNSSMPSTAAAHHHMKPMQLSNEQMQAMAYQQMMMQQQMKMAYAMQQQHQGRAPNTAAAAAGGVMPVVFPGMMMMGPPGGVGVAHAGGGAHRNAATASFSFMDAPKTAKKDDTKFDFVKDAMMGESKKH